MAAMTREQMMQGLAQRKASRKRKGGGNFIQAAMERPGAKGGLHRTTHTPMGQPIPAAKKRAAMAGKYGPKGRKQALLARNMGAKF